jgi:DNA-binding NarL/FixJ family response regulator
VPYITGRVLIADDSRVVRNVIKTFLETRSNLTICGEAANGREAVERTLALKPDLVLLDLSMPELNGAEAASVIKESFPGVRVILFTMFSEEIGTSLTAAIGIDAVLSKPDGMTVLVKTIEDLITGKKREERSWDRHLREQDN